MTRPRDSPTAQGDPAPVQPSGSSEPDLAPLWDAVQALIEAGWQLPLQRPSRLEIDDPIYDVVNAAWRAMPERREDVDWNKAG